MLVFSNLGGCSHRSANFGQTDTSVLEALQRCIRDINCEPNIQKVMLDASQLPSSRRVLEILDIPSNLIGILNFPEAINAIRSHAATDPNLAARILIRLTVRLVDFLSDETDQSPSVDEVLLGVVEGLAQRLIVSGSDLQPAVREQAISALQAISGLESVVPTSAAKAQEILANIQEPTPENDPEILKILQNIPGLIAKGQDAIQAAAAAIAALQAVNNNDPAQQVAAAAAAANRALNRKSIFKKPIFWAAVGGSLVIAIGIGAALKRRSHPIVIHRVPKLV